LRGLRRYGPTPDIQRPSTPRPPVRVRVLDVNGKLLRRATVLATTSPTFEDAKVLEYASDWSVFGGALPPNTYFMLAAFPGLQTQIRQVEIGPNGGRFIFVLGRSGLRYYRRGNVKVPFDHPDTYAVALRYGNHENTFVDLAIKAGVDLTNLQIEEVKLADEVSRQGVHVFRVAPGRGPAFERVCRGQPFVAAGGAVVRMTSKSVTFLTDEIVYRLASNSPHPDLIRQAGLDPKSLPYGDEHWVVTLPQDRDSLSLLEFCNELAASGGPISWAEPNLFSTVVSHAPAVTFESDTEWQTQQPHHELIETVGAWKQGATGAGTTVAVVDSGFDRFHPDFNDDTGQSRIDRTYNFFADNVGLDSDQHGTSAAGIAAGRANASTHFAGIAPDARLVLIERSGASDTNFADIFRWCAGDPTTRSNLPPLASPVDVVSCSWDIGFPSDLASLVKDALASLEAKGCVVVFSSGNSVDKAFDLEPFGELAAYATNVAVGSSSLADPTLIAGDSGFGDALDLVAPGGGDQAGATAAPYPSTSPNPVTGLPYGSFFQTSCACPQVAGIVALMQSARVHAGARKLSAATVRQLLTATAVKIPDASIYAGGFNVNYGFGRVNARKAVEAALQEP